MAAWLELSAQLQSILDAPGLSGSLFDHPYVGRHTLGDAVTLFILPDVLIHTWDLARATGLDETLDADEVDRMFTRVHKIDDELREGGQYGPRLMAPADADEQAQLLAFLGRQP